MPPRERYADSSRGIASLSSSPRLCWKTKPYIMASHRLRPLIPTRPLPFALAKADTFLLKLVDHQVLSDNVVTHGGTYKDTLGGEEEANNPRHRRRSRWDLIPSEADQNRGGDDADIDGRGRKRKSRWAEEEPKPIIQLPNFMKEFTVDLDPEVHALNFRLLEINCRLQSILPLDDLPEGGRSPILPS